MLFSSTVFMYWFLPLVIAVYFAVTKKAKNLVLLIFSLGFYFIGEPKYIIIMLVSIISAFSFGFWIDKAKNKKLPMILSVGVSLSLLLFFKYTDFFIGNINGVFGTELSLLKLALPIGISFYTFQAISYTVDLYRGDAKLQKNFINFASYIALFPQLIAGPIVRYTVIEDQLENRTHTVDRFSSGVTRLIIGLSKKVIIANVLGEVGEKLQNAGEETILFYWMGAVAYTLHIYFDFSGYSDMAIGLGRIFGFEFLENFNYPFISKSISEFWRRWHISLGSWFKDYVYIPLGGSKVNLLKWVRNILVVWFLTGFWHGASWNFIVWGLYFAVFLFLEKMFLIKFLEKIPQVFSHIYVMFFVVISFVIFSAIDLSTAFDYMKCMFTGEFSSPETLYYLKSYLTVFVVAIIGSTPLPKILVEKIKSKKNGEKIISILTPVFTAVMLLVVTGYLIDGSFNPFLYLRF